MNENEVLEIIDKHIAKDAIGNPIDIGSTYGYSNNGNGITTTVVGEAVDTTTESGNYKVKLKIIKRFRTAYANNANEESIGNPHVTVKSNMIFKLYDINVCDNYDPEIQFPFGNGKCKNCGKYHDEPDMDKLTEVVNELRTMR